jgi:hypothetical protein
MYALSTFYYEKILLLVGLCYVVNTVKSCKVCEQHKFIYSTVLPGVIDRLIQIGRCCGTEMNVE